MRPICETRPLDGPPDGEECWNAIGVGGDRTCPRLAEAVHCRNCAVFEAAAARLFDRGAPAGYLDEWTRELARVETDELGDTVSLVVFRLGGEWLALKTVAMVEVVEARPIHRVPHRSDRLFLGLANIRGELQLCASLRELLGIDPAEDPPGAKARFLVAEHAQVRWVFPADEVSGVCRIPSGALEKLPATVERSARRFAQAVVLHEDRQVGLLDENRLFEALERAIR